jgi:hypothetical protein
MSEAPSRIATRHFATKADLRAALRSLGLGRAAADKLLAGGWRALAGEQDAGEDMAGLVAEVRKLVAATKGTRDGI